MGVVVVGCAHVTKLQNEWADSKITTPSINNNIIQIKSIFVSLVLVYILQYILPIYVRSSGVQICAWCIRVVFLWGKYEFVVWSWLH